MELNKRLNLAVGKKPENGYINSDIIKYDNIDICFDMNKYPYPFKDNQFEEIKIINSIHCIEDLGKFMGEIYRIAKPNCIFKIKVQYFLSTESANDYQTKSFYNFNTFSDSDFEGRFKIIRREWIFSENKYLKIFNFLPNISPRFYGRLLYFYFPSNKLYFELKILKNSKKIINSSESDSKN